MFLNMSNCIHDPVRTCYFNVYTKVVTDVVYTLKRRCVRTWDGRGFSMV